MAFFDGRNTDSEPRVNLVELTNVRPTGKIIGRGSFGRVIEVYVHETLCAAKEIHSILIEDVTSREFEGTKQLFLTECANASQLNHPNVVQVLGICFLNPVEASPSRRLPCLVMELMEMSLTHFIEKYDKVALHVKLSLLVDVAQGLEFLHCNQNIIHRDLSSNNVLLTKGLVAKIADFGVAKVMKQSKNVTQTQAPGTQYFMPPEALSVKPRYGKPVDIFSLACIILHVMSHQWPQPKMDQVHLDPVTHQCTVVSEAARREEYLCLCTPPSLKSQVELCLHNVSDLRPDISAVCKALKDIKAEADQKAPFPIASNIDLLGLLQEKELQIQSLNKKLGTLLEKEVQILSLNKKLSDAECILKQNENDMKRKDQELQQLKAKISDLQQQLEAQMDYVMNDASKVGLGWDCESEEIQFTTKMQHGHHYKTRGIKYAGLHLGDEGQRKQQITGQLHRAGIEIEGQHRYGSIGKGDYDWKYRMLGNQGRLLVEDIKEGLRRGYKLEEIQVATELCGSSDRPCDFLSTEWNNYIDRTMFLVNQLSEAEHRRRRMTGSIGRPCRGEIVQYLIEEEGSCERAAQKCCDNRFKMIQELMIEIRLPQSDAVRALENNGLDVNKAIHAVYRDKINSNQLYQYMWGKLEDGDIRQKQNETVEKMITQQVHNDYYLQRLLMAQYKLPTTANCNVLFELVRECGLTLTACIDMAKVNDDIEQAKSLLIQECPVCCLDYTRNEMVNMLNCDHAMCQCCFDVHFSIMITEKSIKHYNCPLCGEPDMSSEAIDLDLYLQLFSGLIQANMKKEQYEMFTQKINEHTMTKDPNFRWCNKCSTGFINEAGRQKIQCPNPTCEEKMCFRCKKSWEDQHENLTCEQFAQWRIDNDPELQAQGLAAYLNEEGIECPSCKFRYPLAKGGCMHFKCTQCPAEFCSGCNNLFRKDCTKYESCREKGLHAHHPRDCLFFLRDESVKDLQKLLKDNNVEFDTKPPEGQVIAQFAKEMQALQGQQAAGYLLTTVPLAAPVLKCHVMLQKENANGPPIDEECGDPVESGHAGLCWKHYKEYLVLRINQSSIDPLPLFETGPLRGILMRDEVKVPDQLLGEAEAGYAERLRQLIKEKMPLEKRAATKKF